MQNGRHSVLYQSHQSDLRHVLCHSDSAPVQSVLYHSAPVARIRLTRGNNFNFQSACEDRLEYSTNQKGYEKPKW